MVGTPDVRPLLYFHCPGCGQQFTQLLYNRIKNVRITMVIVQRECYTFGAIAAMK
jgi:hypothetical protein